MRHVGFLYNHDVPHQIRHTAPIIPHLAGRLHLHVLTSSELQEQEVRRLLPEAVQAQVTFHRLAMGRAMRLLRPLADRFAPFSRVAMLRDNLDLFRRFDALVVPETTTTLLKSRFGLAGLKLIFVPHGVSAGGPGHSAPTRLFDLVLLFGPKLRETLIAEGLVTRAGSAIIGYPKFDTIDRAARPRFFADDKPVVLYNPHFNPYLSSWYTMGEAVLRHFASQSTYNLIFAPHVMLAKRRIHISPLHRRLHWRKDVPQAFLGLPHLRIDMGSRHSIDMSYALAADIYLGDVSSQIYEWIIRPRPAIFLRAHGGEPAQSKGYLHWPMGQIVDRVEDLPAALARTLPFDPAMKALQEQVFAENFSLTDQPSASRAADAIASFLNDKAGADTAPAPSDSHS
jgi:hypothetical protein